MSVNRSLDYTMWLSYNNQKETIVLPVNPPTIQINEAGGGKSFEVSGLGEINAIQNKKLMDISFESFFPAAGAEYPFIVKKEALRPPEYYISAIRGWMMKKRPVRFVFTGASFDLNLPVSIEKFDWKENAGSGDIEYSLSLKQYVFYGARPVIVKNSVGTAKNNRPADAIRSERTYRMVAGDTLIKIAKKQLGDDSRWREIQKLNGISDAALKKLQIGMVLKLPR
ncbi:LysM peptidoglycan-binding domain-containing protein [Paenibacillus sp. NEAU-GSW1]|uniref:LysM peptidoglycan-binding domain-containing protein n=1 Tax=Paenibacillus sp. NEAU-GSW1 TaxID=2682486 RepID=UPI0012E280FA|nr:LysM peptidoglycan-binding domain-containing protein [Paenibacillus sp. NEAU-GSW1]MUT67826.1 LysM peptidoglycan-binding domain-containing protein [Paenibacillus sp. NEAU-GSW1]